jgi:hypothetical protein
LKMPLRAFLLIFPNLSLSLSRFHTLSLRVLSKTLDS